MSIPMDGYERAVLRPSERAALDADGITHAVVSAGEARILAARGLDEDEDVLERARQRVEDAMDGRGRRPWSDDERRQDAAPDSSRGER